MDLVHRLSLSCFPINHQTKTGWNCMKSPDRCTSFAHTPAPFPLEKGLYRTGVRITPAARIR